MFRQALEQTQTLRQQQLLVPQQLQSLEILLLPSLELEQKIGEELMENPTLEIVEHGAQQLMGNPIEDEHGGPAAQEELAAQAAEKDEALATLIQLDESWHDYVPPSHTGSAAPTEEEEGRHQFVLNSMVAEPSLQEMLSTQLRQQAGELEDHIYRICEEIVGDIDERGYLTVSLEDVAIARVATVRDVEIGLKVVQAFDPPGIGARDLRECLLLQLERRERKGSLAYRIVSRYLEELGRNHIPRILSGLRISSSEFHEALDEIRGLHPFPGTLLAPGNTNFIIPEVTVEKDESGEWQVLTNRDCVPRLGISHYYLNMLKKADTSQEVKTYIRQKIADSKVLIKALGQRESTIERIAKSLLIFQRDFFDNGIHGLKPLVLNTVAEDIGVHETTVSRAVSGKYIKTPHGLMPFKFFFSSGLGTTDGEMVSSRSIKQMIEELVQDEDSSKPMSDQKLAAQLKERGFNVARRTVAKYREELGILPSNLRRAY